MMNYKHLDNDLLINTLEQVIAQLSKLAKPLGQNILAYSKLRNELAIVFKEINDRISKNTIDLDKYDKSTQEVLRSINRSISELEKVFPGGRDTRTEEDISGDSS